MTNNIALVRQRGGEIAVRVAGHYALGATVFNMGSNGTENVAVVHIPLSSVTFEEQDDTVVPFRARARRG